MNYVKGLYASLVLIMFVNLANTTIFNDEYSGIAMFVSSILFVIGTGFYVEIKKNKNTKG